MLHALYVAEHLLGRPAVRVSAWVSGNERHPLVEATALCRLETGGPVALVNVGWGIGPGGVFIEGDAGSLDSAGGTAPPPVPAARVDGGAHGRRPPPDRRPEPRAAGDPRGGDAGPDRGLRRRHRERAKAHGGRRGRPARAGADARRLRVGRPRPHGRGPPRPGRSGLPRRRRRHSRPRRAGVEPGPASACNLVGREEQRTMDVGLYGQPPQSR
jgi:hypothetical protein